MKLNHTFNTQIKKLSFLILLFFLVLVSGCKKMVEVKTPTNRLLKDDTYSNAQTAIGVINNIYITISGSGMSVYQLNAIPLITGLSADEISINDLSLDQQLTAFYQNKVDPLLISYPSDIWSNTYQQIYSANDIIENVPSSTNLNADIKTQLLGEAKFVRAFCYFYLTNLYGDVPLVLTTEYQINRSLKRAPQSDIFNQIISDLKESQSLLSEDFLDGTLTQKTFERVRPTKWAATAMLAKVYLYTHNWAEAEIESSKVINKSDLFQLDSLNGVFRKNSIEAIWQAQPTGDTYNTLYGLYFIIPDNQGPNYAQPTFINERLIKSFEVGDERKNKWIKSTVDITTGLTYYFPYKYKEYLPINVYDPLVEYYMMLRLADLILIRSEARAQLNKLGDALNDIKLIRTRANLPTNIPLNKDVILNAIEHERRVELFVEWGDRWFDLKRTGKIDEVMTEVSREKGGIWKNFKKYLPISVIEQRYNSNLTQTPGY